MKKIILTISLLIALLLLIGCAQETDTGTKPSTLPTDTDLSNLDSCAVDSDCICGGVDTTTEKCFLGNKEYYNKFVDKSKSCPDFCTGIAGNLQVRCVNDKCMQMYGCLTDMECGQEESCVANKCVQSGSSTSSQCSKDSDCKTDGCSGQLCRPTSGESIFTTCEFREEYNCLKMVDCGCNNGECAWSTSTKYEACLDAAKNMASDGPQ